MAQVMYSMELDEIDMPHVVVTNMTGCALPTFSGPYASGLAALAVAEAERRLEVAAGGGARVRFSVAPLYPGMELHELRELPIALAEPDAGTDGG